MKKIKMKKKPLPVHFPSRNKINLKRHSVNNFIKSAVAASLCTILIVISLIPIINNVKVSESLIALGGISSAIATVVICFYTVKSVSEVIKSNKETAANNHKRDIKETFEKKFSLLLQEHNRYLEKIILSNNYFYKTTYFQNVSGYESYAIIRGLVKIAAVDGYKFCMHNDEILIKVDIVRNIKKNIYYYLPSSKSFEDPEHVILHPDSNYYSCGYKTYHYFPSSNNFSLVGDLSFISESEDNSKICINLILSKGEVARTLINKNNNTSKNILSPYMRIVYHLLKCSSENTNDKIEMKKYTNIVRSVIPYDILMLIAVNAMFFYKSHDESRNELRRWSDIFNELDNDIHKVLFNDYHKYYELLIKCDFFEHLNMKFSKIIPRFSNLELRIDLSYLKIITFNSGKTVSSSGRNKYFLMIDENSEQSVIKLYKSFHQEIMNIQTDLLILLFYFEDTQIGHAKRRVMDAIIYSNRKTHLQGRIKNKIINLILCDSSAILKEQNRLYLARDFLEKYSKGKLPESI